MSKRSHAALTAIIILAIAMPLMGQGRGRVSPHETISAVIDGDRVTVVYGRPYSKEPNGTNIRKIWGGLVPWGKAWRLGSDESTVLITEQPIMMGDTTIPAGAYRLYLIPMETGTSKLSINKKIGGWGIKSDQSVDETEDLARVDVKKDAIDQQMDQFVMAIDRNPAGGGILKMTWEKTQFSVPFTVKK